MPKWYLLMLCSSCRVVPLSVGCIRAEVFGLVYLVQAHDATDALAVAAPGMLNRSLSVYSPPSSSLLHADAPALRTRDPLAVDVELLPMAADASSAGRPANIAAGGASTRSVSHDGVSAPRLIPATKVTVLAHAHFKVCSFMHLGHVVHTLAVTAMPSNSMLAIEAG